LTTIGHNKQQVDSRCPGQLLWSVVVQERVVEWKILCSFVGNLVLFSAVKEFWKSVKIWESYCQKFGGFFFGTRCIYAAYVFQFSGSPPVSSLHFQLPIPILALLQPNLVMRLVCDQRYLL